MTPCPKSKRWHSKKYEKFVASLPCARCGHPEAVCHHAKGIGGMNGVGLKAPSWASMPLCEARIGSAGCHRLLHDGKIDNEAQWIWISKTLGKAIEEGILKL